MEFYGSMLSFLSDTVNVIDQRDLATVYLWRKKGKEFEGSCIYLSVRSEKEERQAGE